MLTGEFAFHLLQTAAEKRSSPPAALQLAHGSEGLIICGGRRRGAVGDSGLFLPLGPRKHMAAPLPDVQKEKGRSGWLASLRGSRGNPNHFARKHARSELRTASINLNEIGRCSTYIFSG